MTAISGYAVRELSPLIIVGDSLEAHDEQDRLDLMRSSVALFVRFEPDDVVGAVEGYEH